jgi:hypothetical protein
VPTTETEISSQETEMRLQLADVRGTNVKIHGKQAVIPDLLVALQNSVSVFKQIISYDRQAGDECERIGEARRNQPANEYAYDDKRKLNERFKQKHNLDNI